jgi:hypothetical protein
MRPESAGLDFAPNRDAAEVRATTARALQHRTPPQRTDGDDPERSVCQAVGARAPPFRWRPPSGSEGDSLLTVYAGCATRDLHKPGCPNPLIVGGAAPGWTSVLQMLRCGCCEAIMRGDRVWKEVQTC